MGRVRQQIKAWLKSVVIDQREFTATTEGTPQGGLISPLLANIALHGLENMLKETVKDIKITSTAKGKKYLCKRDRAKSLNVIRYADDFLVLHKDLHVVNKCRDIISDWLKDIGLELKPSKTRIAHTLIPELSEDGKAGFDFLGHHIRQYPVGKYNCAKHMGRPLGFRTLITPSKEAGKRHQRKIKDVIKKHKYSSQAKLITELNPVIRGWINFYRYSDATTSGEYTRQNNLLFQKLRAWGRHKTGNRRKAYNKYWRYVGNKRVFSTKTEDKHPLELLSHTEIGSSSTEYVKVKDKESPFNGNLIYWSTRLGRSPDLPIRKSILLKKQKGICHWCNLHFQEGNILETDHIIPRALGGKDIYDNLQLLHGHCHDEKTALDLEFIRNQKFLKYLEYINQELNKNQWFWDKYDNLIIFKTKAAKAH